MNLKRYVPDFYFVNVELNAILDAIQPEINLIINDLQDIFKDAFAIIATSEGILKWEVLLGIVADPSIENIEFRRGRIINRLSSTVPYTERFLQQIMDTIMGAGNWSYDLRYPEYELHITSLRPGRNWLREMELTLEKIIPANILWFLHIYYQTWRAVKENNATWRVVKRNYNTWRDVLEGTETTRPMKTLSEIFGFTLMDVRPMTIEEFTGKD